MHRVDLELLGAMVMAKGRAERMSWVAEFLRSCQADVVFLQEVFLEADVSSLVSAAKDGKLANAHFFQGGMLRGELLLVTAYPIAEAHFHGYAVPGNPSAVTHGDYYAGKGVGQATLQTPAGLLTVFNTHICANYSHKYTSAVETLHCRIPCDSEAAVRVSQVLQLAGMVQARMGVCVKGSLGTIVAGDLNCAPDSLEMHMFRALLPQLHHCWQQVHPHQPGFTSNAVDNSFTKQGGDPPSRIDYIWVSGSAEKAWLTMQQAHRGCSYSDHLGLEAVCTFQEGHADRWTHACARDIMRQHLQLFTVAQRLLQQGADSYQGSRRMLVQASILFLCVALVSLAVAIAFPWWQSYGAAYPVVLSIAGGCFMAAPATFILGFAGCGATAAALGEDAEALQLCLASRDPP